MAQHGCFRYSSEHGSDLGCGRRGGEALTAAVEYRWLVRSFVE